MIIDKIGCVLLKSTRRYGYSLSLSYYQFQQIATVENSKKGVYLIHPVSFVVLYLHFLTAPTPRVF